MKVNIVGMGMGYGSTLTCEAKEILHLSDIVIGAERLINTLPKECGAIRLAAVKAEEIIELIEKNSMVDSICVLMSGDIGFYSGAKKLLALLKEYEVRLIPGISSVQYFAAKLGRPWQEWKLVSAHGKECDVLGLVRRNRESFFLTGGVWGVRELCCQLRDAGLGDCLVAIGERLGSINERIVTGTAAELVKSKFDNLAVMLVENPNPFKTVSCGLADDIFMRGNIPMTKSEVRSVILSKLRLSDSDLVYDVGAGTGSVAVEAALLMKNGHVYAFEREPEGCYLIEENAKKLGASNLTCIRGQAPASFVGLPLPDAAFIGGSGGELVNILEYLLKVNPSVRLVISAVTLETLAQVTAAFTRLPIHNIEIVQIAVSRAELLGEYHLMRGQNPVFILSGVGKNG